MKEMLRDESPSEEEYIFEVSPEGLSDILKKYKHPEGSSFMSRIFFWDSYTKTPTDEKVIEPPSTHQHSASKIKMN